MAIQALFVFVLLDIGFRVSGFARVYRLVRFLGRRSSVDVTSSAAQREMARRVLKAVRTATRYYYRRRLDCLPRALTIYVLLRRRGVPATLRIGVKRFPFAAHAWVECMGEVIDDSTDDWRHEPYVPILSTGQTRSSTSPPSTVEASRGDRAAPGLSWQRGAEGPAGLGAEPGSAKAAGISRKP